MTNSKLLAAMSIYGLGSILSRSLAFLLLPLYTRSLTPAAYGSLELAAMSGSLLAMIIAFMISSGYVRNYYDSSDERQRRELFASAFWFTSAAALIIGGLVFVSAGRIATGLFHEPGHAAYLQLICVSTGILVHNQLLYNVLMVEERPQQYVAVNLAALVLTMVTTIVLVVFLKWGVKGILVAQVAGGLVEFGILVAVLRTKPSLLFSVAKVRAMLAYSTPLIPLQAAAFVLELSDRYYLKLYDSLQAVGMYALAYRFAALLPLLVIQPLRGFTPHIYSLAADPPKCKQALADILRYVVAGSLFLALAIALFAREVIMIMADPAYHQSWRVIFPLCLSYVLYAAVVTISYAIEIVKKNWVSGLFWVIAAGVNLLLNAALIPAHGVWGAALATIAAYAVIVVACLVAVNSLYPVPYAYRKLGLLLLLTLLGYGLSLLLHFALLPALIAKCLLLLLYLRVVATSGYFTREERGQMRALFRSLVLRLPGTTGRI